LTEDRGTWRSVMFKAGQKLSAIGPHPLKKGRGREAVQM